MHMCRGNHESSWAAEGGYDPVAELAFSAIDVDALFLEYDSPRAGSFAPLKFLAKDKTAVLGLVTTKKGKLETKDEIKRRIEEAARVVPLSQLALSPQCGFASTIKGNALTVDRAAARSSSWWLRLPTRFGVERLAAWRLCRGRSAARSAA